MLETVAHVGALQVFGVKLQLLHILSDTDLGDFYKKQPFGDGKNHHIGIQNSLGKNFPQIIYWRIGVGICLKISIRRYMH